MSNQAKQPIVSDKTAQAIRTALNALHGALISHCNESRATPTFPSEWSKCNTDEEYKHIVRFARQTLIAKEEQIKEERFAPYRAAIKDASKTYMTGARKAKVAYDALPAEVREFAPAFPSNVDVPFAAFTTVWGKVENVDIIRDLKTMGYTVGETKKGWVIRLPFEVEQAEDVVKAA